MAAVRFDTLDYARKLERAGVPAEQEALQATALSDALAQTGDLHHDLARLEIKVDRGFADVDARLKQVDARIDHLEVRIDRLDGRFDQVDARFKQVDARFEQVDARFQYLESKLGTRIDALDSKLTGKMATLHWMFGTMVALVAAIFIQTVFRP